MDSSAHVARPLSLLHECCEQGTSCRLHLPHTGDQIPAMFQAVRHRQLILRVAESYQAGSFHVDALCCISFPVHQSFCAFLGCVTGFETTGGGANIEFNLPQEIESTNLRRSFRVPVVREAHVELMVCLRGRARLTALPVNASDSGLEAQLATDEELIEVNDPVRLDIRFRKDLLELPAVVRRREASHFGFELDLPQIPESRERLAAWQKMVRSLEQVWLKNRLS